MLYLHGLRNWVFIFSVYKSISIKKQSNLNVILCRFEYFSTQNPIFFWTQFCKVSLTLKLMNMYQENLKTDFKSAKCFNETENLVCGVTWEREIRNRSYGCEGSLSLSLISYNMPAVNFSDSSVGKESTCNAGDRGLIRRSGRSPGEGIGYPLQYSWVSLLARVVKNLPAMSETWVWSLGLQIPWRRERLPTPVFWPGEFYGLYSPWVCKESDMTEWLSLSQWISTIDSIQYFCCCCVAESCPTICDPRESSMPAFPVLHHLLEFAQTHVHQISDAIQPSYPLSSPFPPAFNLSQHEHLFQWVSSLYPVAKVLEL